MAKVYGTFGTDIRGSLGKVTFRQTRGVNVASQKVSNVKNPRTTAQQTQRMTLLTVSRAYSALKGICDHSFEGITYGAPSMDKFMSLNTKKLKGQELSFAARSLATIAPNAYIISQGSLEVLQMDTYAGRISALKGIDAKTYTVQQLHDALGAKVGDQLTFVGIYTNDNMSSVEVAADISQPACEATYARVVFKSSAASSLAFEDEGNTNFSFNTEAIDTDASLNVKRVHIIINTAQTIFETYVESADSVSPMANGLILSRKENGKWLRSNSVMACRSKDDMSGWEGYFATNAINTYDPSSPYYLNNAAD